MEKRLLPCDMLSPAQDPAIAYEESISGEDEDSPREAVRIALGRKIRFGLSNRASPFRISFVSRDVG